jgi:hypothetical protein
VRGLFPSRPLGAQDDGFFHLQTEKVVTLKVSRMFAIVDGKIRQDGFERGILTRNRLNSRQLDKWVSADRLRKQVYELSERLIFASLKPWG